MYNKEQMQLLDKIQLWKMRMRHAKTENYFNQCFFNIERLKGELIAIESNKKY